MSSRPATIVWFRQDLRVADHAPLSAAVARGGPVIPVYVWAPQDEGKWAPGGASRWWLHHSLDRLGRRLKSIGSRLILREGKTFEALSRLVEETGADAIFFHRRYEPAAISVEQKLVTKLASHEVKIHGHNGTLLHEPEDVRTQQGKPYQVFTPFWRSLRAQFGSHDTLVAPSRLPAPRRWPGSLSLDELGLLPELAWAGGLEESWKPGEEGAQAEIDRFLEVASRYDTDRDVPSMPATSRLSPHLHFGEVSPRQVWNHVGHAIGPQAEPFLRQLGWREFAHHLLFHFPHTTERPLREVFSGFPWRRGARELRAWQRGRTGYPFVDAGMRQLWHTGWMHNRLRMVVASFLVKDLLITWREGARWFWDTLVDADLANNTLGWQWCAGCGADAAPYFRIFNPVTQGEKFDPDGAFIREWVPERAGLDGKLIHQPWNARETDQGAAEGDSGRPYPGPIVDHGEARERALAAYDRIKQST